MAHRFALKDVARQAGLGLATVDRVINGRGGVRSATEQRVRQAIDELSRQTLEATAAGRRLVIDLVMDAPDRFSAAVRAALEAELPSLLPAAFRVRAHLAETEPAEAVAARLARIRARGSHGVLLKAPDHPAVRAAVAGLAAARIPTVTLVTDLPQTPRLAYVGMDNDAAGSTAAWIVANWMGGALARERRAVLVTASSWRFLGEEQREAGFRRTLAALAPDIGIVRMGEGWGIDRQTGEQARAALAAHPEIAGIYSIGGGNRAIAGAFAEAGRRCAVFVGHDLDSDNRALLAQGAVSAVLHHDLHRDMRAACRVFLQAHRILPRRPAPPLSPAAIVTRFNMPPEPTAPDAAAPGPASWADSVP